VPGQRKALVVVTDHYVHPALSQLAAPSVDAAELVDVLGAPNLGDFAVQVVADADSWTVAETVEGLLGDCDSSDLILMHFSCHGIKDDAGELYLATSNTSPNRLASTAVDSSLLNRLMQRSRARRVVLFLDCCYGGAFERGAVARAGGDIDVASQFDQQRLGGGRGRVVITASSAMEYAFEGSTLTEGSASSPSIFTGALVEGIRTGAADRDQDGQVALHELYDYVHDKVKEETPHQTPCKWEFGMQGDIYIARNPNRRIVPSPLSPELMELVRHPHTAVRCAAVDELERLAISPALPLAAGARLALGDLISDDSRRVHTAATAALERVAIRLVPDSVNLGDLVPDQARELALRIEGGPIAHASAVVTSDGVRARVDGPMLRIVVRVAQPDGRFHGTVRLSGIAGEATADLVGQVAPSRGLLSLPPPTDPHGSTDSAGAPPRITAVAGRRAGGGLAGSTTGSVLTDPRCPVGSSLTSSWTASIALSLLTVLGAFFLGWSLFLPTKLAAAHFVFIQVSHNDVWLALPAVAAISACFFMRRPRRSYWAVGLMGGGALQLWLFVVHVLVREGTDPATSAATVGRGIVGTGLWAWILAALCLTCAVCILARTDHQLGPRPHLTFDTAASAGVVIALTSVGVAYALQVTSQNPSIPVLSIDAILLLTAVSLMTLTEATNYQRLAKLVGVTCFALCYTTRGWPLPGNPGGTRGMLISAALTGLPVAVFVAQQVRSQALLKQ
jgi:hypothetical protein